MRRALKRACKGVLFVALGLEVRADARARTICCLLEVYVAVVDATL